MRCELECDGNELSTDCVSGDASPPPTSVPSCCIPTSGRARAVPGGDGKCEETQARCSVEFTALGGGAPRNIWRLPQRLTSVFLESFYQLKNRECSLLSALIKTRIDPFYSSSQGQSCTDKYVVIIKLCPVHYFTKFFAPTLLSCLPVEMDESCTINYTND